MLPKIHLSLTKVTLNSQAENFQTKQAAFNNPSASDKYLKFVSASHHGIQSHRTSYYHVNLRTEKRAYLRSLKSLHVILTGIAIVNRRMMKYKVM